jgi:hypothetical protein
MARAAIILLLAAGTGCSRFDAAPTVIGPPIDQQPVVVVPIEACPPEGAVFTGPPMAMQPMMGQPFVMPGEIPAFPPPVATAPPVLPQAVPPPAGPLEFGLPSEAIGIPGQVAAGSILPNPLRVPVTNHEFAWDQIAQVVSNYFPIQREERVRIEGDMWTEGRLETPYRIAATALEPWRGDSVGTFNLWQSTLQTIRRRAMVRVVPEGNNYAIEVRVDKELEDLPQPEQATAGIASLRTDTALPSALTPEISRVRASQLWIPLGRDAALEQKMLAEMQSRLGAAPQVRTTVGGF